ncbi:MAG: class I SAM-dependent methyltransferase [Nitrospirota bacterium]
MNSNIITSQDIQDLKPLFGESLPQRFLTYRLLTFLAESGITDFLTGADEFTMGPAEEMLKQKFGIAASDTIRTRMIQIALDFLYECGIIHKEGMFFSRGSTDYDAFRLSKNEIERAGTFFGGQISFFNECINYSEKFLRGAPPLFRFDEKSLDIWERFLGNTEFETARILLMKLLSSKKTGSCKILNLCSGLGFDISAIQNIMPDAEITAIDFTDVFRERALGRVEQPETVRWEDSRRWDGFGSALPFSSETFDLVFFSCADPYIPQDAREFAYRDIFRTIKKGGSFGILTNSYPDPEKKGVLDRWVRRGVLCHDFAESVCEGWYGFSLPEKSAGLFQDIGFKVSSVLLNSSLWRLDKP